MEYRSNIKELLLLALIVFFGLSAQSWAALVSVSTGTISQGNGLEVGGNWDAASLSWDVGYDASSNLWTYKYTFTVSNNPGISHVIIQTSDDLKDSEIASATSEWDLDSYGSEGGSNPGWEGAEFTGIKWIDPGDGTPSPDDDLQQELTWNWSIVTNHGPMWGDFYAKGGQSFAHNTGMGTVLSDENQHNYNTIQPGFILVPNSKGGPPNEVPAPASLLLLGSGLMGVSLIRRKREKK